MEETTKSLWNKTASELTVKDNLIVAAAIPAVLVGGIVAVSVTIGAASSAVEKFRTFRANRKNTTTEES